MINMKMSSGVLAPFVPVGVETKFQFSASSLLGLETTAAELDVGLVNVENVVRLLYNTFTVSGSFIVPNVTGLTEITIGVVGYPSETAGGQNVRFNVEYNKVRNGSSFDPSTDNMDTGDISVVGQAEEKIIAVEKAFNISSHSIEEGDLFNFIFSKVAANSLSYDGEFSLLELYFKFS